MIKSSQVIARSSFRPIMIGSTLGQKRTFATSSSGRPISPHVQIYAFPPTAISSITNRVTGCMLATTFMGLGWVGLISGHSPEHLVDWVGQSTLLSFPAKLCVTFPLTYHFVSGIRHLWWDETLKSLDLKTAHTQSWFILGGAGLISLFLATCKIEQEE